jgi:hypothetical protein
MLMAMSKNSLLALTFTSISLAFLIVASLFVNLGIANPMISTKYPPTITVFSPAPNTTYKTNTVNLHFTVTAPTVINDAYGRPMTVYPKGYVQYFLDGVQLGSFSEVNLPEPVSRNLDGLSEGIHTLHVFAYNQFIYMAGNPSAVDRFVNFTIDAAPPAISIILMPRAVMHETDLPLKLSVTEQVTGVEYVIDEKPSASLMDMTKIPNGNSLTINGNASLAGLPAGQHSITLYAADMAGSVGTSQTLQFTIAQTAPTPSPTQTAAASQSPSPSPSATQQPEASPSPSPKKIELSTYVFATIVIIIVAGLLALAFYEKHGKQKTES